MPTLGTPGRSSSTPGCCATQLMMARHVPTLVIRAVDLSHTSGVTEPPGIPRQHVKSALPELGDAEGALDPRLRRVGVAGLTPTWAHEYGRTGPAVRRRVGEPVDPDGRAVERREVEVGRDARHRYRLGGLPAARRLAVRRCRSRRPGQQMGRGNRRNTGRAAYNDEADTEGEGLPRSPQPSAKVSFGRAGVSMDRVIVPVTATAPPRARPGAGSKESGRTSPPRTATWRPRPQPPPSGGVIL